MPRGKKICIYERQLFARAWAVATQNSLKGADQKVESFNSSIYRILQEIEPKDAGMDKYSNRSARNVAICIRDTIFPDISKFMKQLMKIKLCQPTGGLLEIDLHKMAIAVHTNRTTGMDYTFCSGGKNDIDPKHVWSNYLAYLEVRDLPKFSLQPDVASRRYFSDDNESGDDEVDDTVPVNATSNGVDAVVDNNDDFTTPTVGKSKHCSLGSIGVLSRRNDKYMSKKRMQMVQQEKIEKEKKDKISEVIQSSLQNLDRNNNKLVKIMSNTNKRNNIREKIYLLKLQYNYYRKNDDGTRAKLYEKKVHELTEQAITLMDESIELDQEVQAEKLANSNAYASINPTLSEEDNVSYTDNDSVGSIMLNIDHHKEDDEYLEGDEVNVNQENEFDIDTIDVTSTNKDTINLFSDDNFPNKVNNNINIVSITKSNNKRNVECLKAIVEDNFVTNNSTIVSLSKTKLCSGTVEHRVNKKKYVAPFNNNNMGTYYMN